MTALDLDAIRQTQADAMDLVQSYYTATTKDQEPRGSMVRVTITRLHDDGEALVAEVERLRGIVTKTRAVLADESKPVGWRLGWAEEALLVAVADSSPAAAIKPSDSSSTGGEQ